MPVATGDVFTAAQQRRIEKALATAVTETGLHWSVFVGDLAGGHRHTCERLHAAAGTRGPGPGPDDTVLVVVSPGQRVVEIVTGEQARRRVTDRAASLAVLSMRTSFEGGDLAGGVLTGVRMLTEAAGVKRGAEVGAVTPPRSIVGRLLGKS